MNKLLIILSISLFLFSCGDGIKNGEYKTYYDNGNIETVVNYKNDKLNGESKSYYENGQIKGEINYKGGKKDGISKSYSENGQLISVETFYEGKSGHGESKYIMKMVK